MLLARYQCKSRVWIRAECSGFFKWNFLHSCVYCKATPNVFAFSFKAWPWALPSWKLIATLIKPLIHFYNTKFGAQIISKRLYQSKTNFVNRTNIWYKVQIILYACLHAIHILTLEYLGYYKDKFHSYKQRLHIVIN